MTIFDRIKEGNLEAVREMAASDPSTLRQADSSGVTPLLFACYYGKREIAEFLSAAVEMNIHEASAFGDRARVESLLDHDPSLLNAYAPDGFFPLGLTLFFGHDEITRDLLRRDADVNQQARNGQKIRPIHAAIAGRRDVTIVGALIERGADVEAVQEGGVRPIHNAAAAGNQAIAELLLEKGADASALMADGSSAEAMARARGHAGLADWLRARNPAS